MEKYQSSTCYCCGKPLSDPISIQLGIGPVCRVSKKMEDMNEKTENLFANRSDYDYRVDGNILAIEDLGGMKSVTNDIENVLTDIKDQGIQVEKLRIMYKDSMGIWDGVKVETIHGNGSFSISFFSINKRLYHKAKIKLSNVA